MKSLVVFILICASALAVEYDYYDSTYYGTDFGSGDGSEYDYGDYGTASGDYGDYYGNYGTYYGTSDGSGDGSEYDYGSGEYYYGDYGTEYGDYGTSDGSGDGSEYDYGSGEYDYGSGGTEYGDYDNYSDYDTGSGHGTSSGYGYADYSTEYGDYDDYHDDLIDATLKCTAGTDVGSSLEAAFGYCYTDTMSPVSDDRKSKTNFLDWMEHQHNLAKDRMDFDSLFCCSFNDIMQRIEEEYADDACVLQTIGWMDYNFKFVKDKIGADIMSLPDKVKLPILEENLMACFGDELVHVEEMVGEDCVSHYSDDEQFTLKVIGSKIVAYERFLDAFERGCWNHLEEYDYNYPTTFGK